MRDPEDLIAVYRKKGMRITPQRRMIFQLLVGDVSHPSVDELYQRVKEKMPDVSLTTVYNTVNELVSLGELHEVEALGDGSTHYDTNTKPHHHLYCVGCHKLLDINPVIEPLNLLPAEAERFKIDRAQVTFYGTCADCQGRGTHL